MLSVTPPRILDPIVSSVCCVELKFQFYEPDLDRILVTFRPERRERDMDGGRLENGPGLKLSLG